MANEGPTEPPTSPSVSLPRSPSPVQRRRLWKPLFVLLLIGCLVWGGIAIYPQLIELGQPDDRRGVLTYEAKRNPLQVIITAEGNVESGSNIEVKCRVAGGSTILWIVEDGKVVQEGDEIIRLDTSSIDDQLNSQRIVYEKALASHIQAEQDLAVAGIAVKEYEQGTFVEQLKQLEAEIQVALENLRSAENQLKYSQRMLRKGFVSSLQRDADEFAVERAKLDLDVATTRKQVLVDFTKEKTLKGLQATREASAARLRSEAAGLQLEKARLERLQAQLKNCVVTAPKKGMVVYANNARRSRYGGSQQAEIEEGSMVRESQALVRLPDLSKMQVKVTVHESRVDQMRPGLPARIVIQDQDYSGQVLSIANQPERSSWFSANVKEYATVVTIDGETSGLKPGMTAKVTILVDDVSDALSVPVSAIVQQRGQFFCWVETPQGPKRRSLQLGVTNDKLIQIVDGVKEGEKVYRNPRAVSEEAREEPPFEEQSGDIRFSAASASDAGAASSTAEATHETSKKAISSDARESSDVGPQRNSAPRRRRGGGFNIAQLDKDGDGKLSVDELPERMQSWFGRLDTNSDGFIDANEIAAMRQMRRKSGGRRGDRERRGSGERPGAVDGSEGERRPARASP